MFQLLLSVALATTSPQTPPPLAETARKINALLPEQEKFIIPSQGNRLLYDRINSFKASGSKSEITKDVLKIADMSLQGCNAFSTESMAPRISDFAKGFDIASEQVAREGNLKKAQSLAHVSLMITQCKGPLILNMVGLHWLQNSVKTLKTMSQRKLKKDDQMRLRALKEQVLGLNTQEILLDVLRFEILSSTTLITDLMETEFTGDYKDPVSDNNEVWHKLHGGKPYKVNWEKASKITVELLNTLKNPKSFEFPEYHAEIAKQKNEGFKTLWTILDLRSQGFEKPEDMNDQTKFGAWLESLKTNDVAMKEATAKLTASPDASTAEFQVSLSYLEVKEEALQRFDARLKDLQNSIKTLIK